MPRFEQEPDPVFWELNASLRYDRRLAPYDVRQSRAHARALHGAGVVDDEELETLLDGLDAVDRELESGRFPFAPEDEDVHMAIERRLTEIVGRVGERSIREDHGTTRSRPIWRCSSPSAPVWRSPS